MDKLIFSIVVGLVAGTVDVIPMIIQKLPRRSIASAFFHYLFVSIVILNIEIPHIAWWLEGGIVGLALTIPMLIQISDSDKKSLPIIAMNGLLLGSIVGFIGHYSYVQLSISVLTLN